MPRPRPKGGSVAAPQQQGPNHAQPLEQAFIVKVMIGDKGPFGFPFEDTRQPVSSILNLIQRFLESMQGVFSLVSGLPLGWAPASKLTTLTASIHSLHVPFSTIASASYVLMLRVPIIAAMLEQCLCKCPPLYGSASGMHVSGEKSHTNLRRMCTFLSSCCEHIVKQTVRELEHGLGSEADFAGSPASSLSTFIFLNIATGLR